MEFSRQEYWSGLPFSSPGNLPNPGIEPRSPALQADALPSEPSEKPHFPSQDPVDHAVSLVLTLFKGHMLSHYCNLPGGLMTSTQYTQKQNGIRMLKDSFCPAIARS